jgi:hypothetical protein
MSKIKSLYEAKMVNGKFVPEYGDELIFRTNAGDVGFNDYFTVGKSYKVESVTVYQASGESVLIVYDDIGRGMIFTIKPDIDGRSFETYFDWNPIDYDTTSDMFDSLNESQSDGEIIYEFQEGVDVTMWPVVSHALKNIYSNIKWPDDNDIEEFPLQPWFKVFGINIWYDSSDFGTYC